MKVEGYNEFILASVFDHEKVVRGFLVKNAKIRKFWLNLFKNHGNYNLRIIDM
jgi:hypothetical protein